jgi:hypothetical protein
MALWVDRSVAAPKKTATKTPVPKAAEPAPTAGTPVAKGKEVVLPEFYLAEAKGDVKVVHKGNKAKAAPPQAVEKDDRIVTGKDGTAYLQIRSGGTIEISPKSDVKVEKFEADPKALKARFKLAFGRMRTVLKKFASSRSTFEIEAGGVVCGVRGTAFEVDHDKDKKNVRAKTFEGSVWAKAQGKETVVDKGFGFLVGDKGSPVLEALSSQEVQEGLKFMKIADGLDQQREMFDKRLKQSLIGTLMEGGGGIEKSFEDAKSKLPFNF